MSTLTSGFMFIHIHNYKQVIINVINSKFKKILTFIIILYSVDRVYIPHMIPYAKG